jgi:hypothetical protein
MQEEDMTVIALFDATVADGNDGADGKDGEPGEDGLNGKSAYDYAQEGGYSGTEESFADSLSKIDNYITNDDIAGVMKDENPVGTGSFSMNRKANTTVGSYSTTLGSNNTASGNCSTAEGYITTASGDKSHAEGSYTTASGNSGSHAEGYYTTASSLASHAEGWYTTASGQFSHAEGNKTTAASKSQHVQGQSNIPDTENKYLHIVGNGDPDYYIQSNAHTLDWNGNAWFAGDVTATRSDGSEAKLSEVPTIQASTEDITAGVTELPSGVLYVVYE